MNSSEKEREEKLIKTIIPKISDYFKENTFLEKENLQEFLEYLGITAWNKENDEEKKEEIWNSLSKDSQEQKLQKIIVIKNITDYIHNHGNELIPPERTLESSVEKFLLSPIQAIYTNENINEDDETIFEFLKFLSLIQFSNNNTIPFFELEKYLKENQFINLNIEKIMEIINNFGKQNLKELKKDLYFNLIEQLGNKFKNKFSDFAKKLKTFEEDELNEPKLKNFENIIDFSNILLKINDSLISVKEKLIQSISNNDKLKSEFYKKYFNVFISDIQVYVYEIERIYYEQNQKFDYFINKINTKINLLNEEKLVLENKLNNQKEETEKKCDKKIKKITEKYEKLQEESEKLKKEIENLQNDIRQKDDNLLIVNNKNSLLENNKNEMDIKYHLLEKEKENLNKNYTDLLNQFNEKIFKEKTELEKENEFKENFKSLNISEEQKNLINMKQEELISYIIERDKYSKTLEESNKKLKEEIENSHNIKLKLEEEKNSLKVTNTTLNRNKEDLIIKINELNSELQDFKLGRKNSLLNSLIKSQSDFNVNVHQILIEEKLNPIFIKKSYPKIENDKIQKLMKKKTKKTNFDFLCLRLDERVIQNLEDDYYNPKSNTVFTELIKYIDEYENNLECIIFINENYLYLFNKDSLEKAFSIPLIYLSTVNISTCNNTVTLIFDSGKSIIIEIFRILELVNFFKTLNSINKTNISINSNVINNKIVQIKKKNYINSPYYGKCQLSSFIKKKYSNFIQTYFDKKFLVLCDLGLIIMDDAMGKPIEIINLLFAKTNEYNDSYGNYCFDVIIDNITHTFSATSDSLRRKWVSEIEDWIFYNFNDQIFEI